MRFTSAELILLLPSVVLAAPQLPTIGLPSIGLPIPSEICYITTVCSTVDATSTSSKAIETSSLFDSTTLLNTTTSSPIESVTILPINITTSSAQVTISPTVISSVTGTGSASYVSTTSGLWNTTTSTTIIPESSTSDISVSTESATTTSTYIPPVSSTTGSFSTSTRTTSSGTAAPTAIEIRGLTYGGSGCSSNSVVSQLSKDKSMLTLMYGAFVAQTGPGLVPADARKNCQLNVAITYPSGWQFSIFKADYRGYANLPTGQKGVVRASYYFSGQSEQVSVNRPSSPRIF